MGKRSEKAKIKKQRRLKAAAEEKAKKEVVQNAMFNEDKTVVRLYSCQLSGPRVLMQCTS